MEISLIILTLKVAAVATVINLPLALIVGWILVKSNTRCRFFLDVLISFPLALPPVTVGFLLLVVFGFFFVGFGVWWVCFSSGSGCGSDGCLASSGVF